MPDQQPESPKPPLKGPRIELFSPYKGVYKTSGREEQPPDTCWNAVNVLPYDFYGRRRAAQRFGIAKKFTQQLESGAPIQGMLSVNFLTYPASGNNLVLYNQDWSNTNSYTSAGTGVPSVVTPSTNSVFGNTQSYLSFTNGQGVTVTPPAQVTATTANGSYMVVVPIEVSITEPLDSSHIATVSFDVSAWTPAGLTSANAKTLTFGLQQTANTFPVLTVVAKDNSSSNVAFNTSPSAAFGTGTPFTINLIFAWNANTSTFSINVNVVNSFTGASYGTGYSFIATVFNGSSSIPPTLVFTGAVSASMATLSIL